MEPEVHSANLIIGIQFTVLSISMKV